MTDTPMQWPAPNAYWGRKFGSRDKDGGLVFRIKRGAATKGSNSGGNTKKHYTRLLASNAIAKGWLNGERRKGQGTQ